MSIKGMMASVMWTEISNAIKHDFNVELPKLCGVETTAYITDIVDQLHDAYVREHDRKDAQRYRWLRDNEQLVSTQFAKLRGSGDPDEMDDATDLAMNATAKEIQYKG